MPAHRSIEPSCKEALLDCTSPGLGRVPHGYSGNRLWRDAQVLAPAYKSSAPPGKGVQLEHTCFATGRVLLGCSGNTLWRDARVLILAHKSSGLASRVIRPG